MNYVIIGAMGGLGGIFATVLLYMIHLNLGWIARICKSLMAGVFIVFGMWMVFKLDRIPEKKH